MNKMKIFNIKQLVMALVITLSQALIVGSFAQTSKEYTADEAAQLKTDLGAKAYDVYILSTSGGVYDFNSNLIKETTTIKAKSGLSEKPIIKSISSSQQQLIRVDNSSVRDTITFEGLEFDGAGFDGSTPLIVRSMDNTHLVFNDCYIHDAYNTNGAIRSDKASSSVDINNTLFANCKQRLVLFYYDFSYGDVNISNCTFTGVTSGDIVYFRSSTSACNEVNIDHCTFYNNEGNVTRLVLDSIHGDVKVTNSIFVDVAGGLNADIIDYNYVDGLGTIPTATNSITTVPTFVDADNMDFALVNKDVMVGSDGATLGDLSWYVADVPPTVMATLIKVDDTHLKVQFSKGLDATTSVEVTNYTISGTSGLSGNPTEAVLDARGKDVILTVSDLSGMDAGQTLIVTVTNVKDAQGTAIADANIATYTMMDMTAPVITMSTQALTNDADKVALAKSNELGAIYLVLDGVAQSSYEEIARAVATGNGAMASVSAVDTDVSLFVANLAEGDYHAYAVDAFENVSVVSANAVTVTDITAPAITMDAQSASNGATDKVLAQSNELGKIYLILEGEAQATLADFEAAVMAKKGFVATVATAGDDVSLTAVDVKAGDYYGYAVDRAGNVSTVGSNVVTITKFIPRIRYYEDADVASLKSDLNSAIDGDVFILTTSGGVYDLAGYVKIASKISIFAQDYLEERPILTNYMETKWYQVLRLENVGSGLSVRGIEFNSFSRDTSSYPVRFAVRTRWDFNNAGDYHLSFEDCAFKGTWVGKDLTEGCAVKVYNGTNADSLIFKSCTFEDELAIDLPRSGNFDWDKFEISNCSFMNIPNTSAIMVGQSGDNQSLPVTIDHCTFYNVGNEHNNTIVADSLYNLSITNSIFASSEATTSVALWGNGDMKALLDYNNFYETPVADVTQGGQVGTNMWTDDPQLADADAGDCTLGNQAMYTLSSEGLPLGDRRWADVYGPAVKSALISRSDSTLLLVYDEWIDTASAIVSANYTLSTSAGVIGTVKSAEIFDFHSVLLTTISLSEINAKDVFVTVSNVKDLIGNTVAAPKNVASFNLDEFRTIVMADAQESTNALGQSVWAQNNVGTGAVYIILEGEAPTTLDELEAAVSAMKGAKATVTTSYMDTEIKVYGLEPGAYWAYTVGGDGTISDKGENKIVITDGIAPSISAPLQSSENGADDYVLVQSNELGKVYLVLDGQPQSNEEDFISAYYAKKGARGFVTTADADLQVSINGLTPGIYYAYALDATGNLSAQSAMPINIVEATSSLDSRAISIQVYASNRKIIIKSDEIQPHSVKICDMAGRNILMDEFSGNYMVYDMDNAGIYFVTVYNSLGAVKTTKLVVE